MGSKSIRAIAIAVFFSLVALVFIVRLFLLQVINPSYKYSAENNTQRKIIDYPSRGLIYDRNGKLLVSNQAVYDVMIVPREVAPFDTAAFCKALNITCDELSRLYAELQKNIDNRRASRQKPSVFFKQLSAEQYGYFQEAIHRFKGFYVQRRTLRKYEYRHAAHVLGYVGEVNDNILKRDSYYTIGDYAGISGIENMYEPFLRGTKGSRYMMVDVHGVEKGRLAGGRMDTLAKSGKNITLSLDIELQEYGELLMQNKIGSIIAIEPATGEILSMVSSPGYDPALLVGRERSRNYPALATDSLSPLLNRAVQSGYPPGSTFKTVMALIGLQEGVLSTSTKYSCTMGYHARGISVGCHSHASPLNLVHSLSNSCNAYYCNVLRSIIENPHLNSFAEGLNRWRNYLLSFGFSNPLGSDLFNEQKGSIPTSDYFNRLYNNRWNGLTVISLSIGQGEILTTPVQMANMTAAIANRGHYYTPHIIKAIDSDTIPSKFTQIHHTLIDTAYFAPVVEGMERAVWDEWGATARLARVQGIRVCGKTGTAQNPHGEDHSIFVAFAPKDNPQIAIAVYVENGGFGATYAAPIASLMIEKYFNREIEDTPARKWTENRILETDLISK
ncbi:MAG: penicillin-binding protein 2 [Cytophagaceae bacterium]|jgi:penicillin-binding protein 2|nr:penicillin-binding protein 2 [Cytophagaceae bacterium]